MRVCLYENVSAFAFLIAHFIFFLFLLIDSRCARVALYKFQIISVLNRVYLAARQGLN